MSTRSISLLAYSGQPIFPVDEPDTYLQFTRSNGVVYVSLGQRPVALLTVEEFGRLVPLFEPDAAEAPADEESAQSKKLPERVMTRYIVRGAAGGWGVWDTKLLRWMENELGQWDMDEYDADVLAADLNAEEEP